MILLPANSLPPQDNKPEIVYECKRKNYEPLNNWLVNPKIVVSTASTMTIFDTGSDTGGSGRISIGLIGDFS